MNITQTFYDNLASQYDKLFFDWQATTQEQALLVAEWIGNYYSNNISYDINYRGEPRLSASDIIKIESDKKANLQVEIENLTLDFDKSFSGTLEVRRATANATGG